MTNKLKIAVLMGGNSSEHEISLLSGREVIRNLDPNKYLVTPIVIAKNGKTWQVVDRKRILALPDFSEKNKSIIAFDNNKAVKINTSDLLSLVDLVFLALHGTNGEDGKIQGMLDLVGLKYTGSGVLASALGMDKLIFRKIMLSESLPIPKFIAIEKNQKINLQEIKNKLGPLPYFVKPHDQGSSVGTSIVNSLSKLTKALNKVWQYSSIALIDEFILGREFTVSVMGNQKPINLPVVEIIPKKGKYFDYQSKYSESGSKEICPAKIDLSLTDKMQKMAIQVYQVVNARGYARIDFLLKNNSQPIILEINTLPGLTPTSLFPKSAKANKIDYPGLLDKIIAYALNQNE